MLFVGRAADPLQTTKAALPGSKWSVILLRSVTEDAMAEVLKSSSQLSLQVYVDDVILQAAPLVVS